MALAWKFQLKQDRFFVNLTWKGPYISISFLWWWWRTDFEIVNQKKDMIHLDQRLRQNTNKYIHIQSHMTSMYWQDNCLVLFSSKIYPKKNIKIQINNHAYCQSSTFLMAKKDNKREFLIKKWKLPAIIAFKQH